MRLFVARQQEHGAPRGGIELLYRAIEDLGSDCAWSDIAIGDRSKALQYVRAGRKGEPTAVWTQTVGHLGPRLARWFTELHAAGAVTLETVVFAQPSRYRPHATTHRTLLLSEDGVHRFVARSLCAGIPVPDNLGVLGNPLLHPVRQDLKARTPDRSLRLLRVGRPDNSKWSRFELDVTTAMARRHPDVDFELTLVGAPYPVPARLPPNVHVAALPYASNPAPFYEAADVYIHHSRIGETFGNTIAEAWAAGDVVCCGLDPIWDSAPVEFLPDPHVLGTPAWIRRKARQGRLLPALLAQSTPWRGLTVRDFVDHLHAAAVGTAPKLDIPSLWKSLHALSRQAQQLHGHRFGSPVHFLAREVVRQSRRKRRPQETFA